MNKIKSFAFSSKDAKEVTINSFWSVIGTVISKGLAFLGWVVVANFLGKELNGEIGIVRSTINLFLIFVGSGLGLTATRYISKYKNETRTKTANIVSLTLLTTLIFGLFISLLFYFFSSSLAKTLNAVGLTETLKLGAFLLFFGGLNGSLKGCLEGFQLFKAAAIINIIFSVALFFGLYFGAKFNSVESTFTGFLLATILHFILQSILLWFELKRRAIKLTVRLKEEIPVLSKFTIPAILSGAMVVPFKWLAEALLVNQPEGYIEMGLFAAIILFQTLLYMIANTLNAPLITLMAKKGENLKIDKISLILPWAIGVFGALPFICFPELFGLIFGDEYLKDANFFSTYLIVLLFTIVMLYKQGIARIMVLNDLMWFSFLSNLIWGLSLTGSFFLLKDSGAVGLAWAYLIAYTINVIIVIPLYLKRKIIPRFLVFSPYAISLWIGVLGLAFICFYFEMNLFIKAAVALISSFIFVFLFYKLFNFSKNA
ncbi:oligosaccharide flippase family protein [Mesonia aquimarina]|uniref:oligosaccharide flippase family protein n=1 Tax=Mesonia aquimarina TaxID=1504967 RepID=UPI0013CE7223|nr:oligosaccharide flippase family protein [Mesonia aquimarina]